ncbi:MAG: MotA/TolQ/ExbB proton channel family protein [Mangrovibacterium sp.]
MYRNKVTFNKNFAHIVDELTVENVRETLESFDIKDEKLNGATFLSKISSSTASDAHYEKLLNEFEIAAQKDMAICQTLAKLGPIMGLMGTLIPMGPALVGLANGDIASMASNMQIAFSTTVIGLFIGAVGFMILQVKKRWFTSDINRMEFVCELLKSNVNK